ncbi:sigma 54-interacting transcriptional regulator [Brevibacillus ruminantium]|uniref:Sigma 54-interacting transcriptional regulator n=1 Tax=Brevibacillus ruminantium TaxID=2950604 RepID=A0ABY4WIN2_9BACL|nr:sigma 54-interacting transcriptional regulator [Brevibacillus ruminantium]USG66903.1 sigma 54-interacting transcriptional regulator [Brevibacillus ruminantium]
MAHLGLRYLFEELPAFPFPYVCLFTEELSLVVWKVHQDSPQQEVKQRLEEIELLIRTQVTTKQERQEMNQQEQHGHTAAGPSSVYAEPMELDGVQYWLALHSGGEQVIDRAHWQLIAVLIRTQWNEKKLAAEMMLHNHYQKQIVETISEGFMAINRSGEIVYVNRQGADILGITVAETIGVHLCDIVDFQPEVLSVLDSGKGWVNKEFFITMPKKGKLHLMKSAIPVFDELGEIIGVIDTFREIKVIRHLVTSMVGAKAFFTFDDIITHSAKVQELIRQSRWAARDDTNILIEGESGTGKELFAHAIHNDSRRANGPFVVIDCSSIPRELVESELFGYVDGAFTGARKGGRPGKFELANGGTVFLDEIGEMPLEIQAKLLRVLQSRYVVRVGGYEPIPIDVRIIAATNRDLEEEVAKRNFRLDLYYRLNVVNLKIPALRERAEDILMLAAHFMRKFETDKPDNPSLTLAPAVQESLQRYAWPGNIRELENVIARACVFAKGDVLGPELFPETLFGRETSFPARPLEAVHSLDEAEKNQISAVLIEAAGNKSMAAKMLGISRSTLYQKMKRYGFPV